MTVNPSEALYRKNTMSNSWATTRVQIVVHSILQKQMGMAAFTHFILDDFLFASLFVLLLDCCQLEMGVSYLVLSTLYCSPSVFSWKHLFQRLLTDTLYLGMFQFSSFLF